jgi:hypothetical protein
MSDAKRRMRLPTIEKDPRGERGEGTEPQGRAELRLVSDRTASWEWESGEGG